MMQKYSLNQNMSNLNGRLKNSVNNQNYDTENNENWSGKEQYANY